MDEKATIRLLKVIDEKKEYLKKVYSITDNSIEEVKFELIIIHKKLYPNDNNYLQIRYNVKIDPYYVNTDDIYNKLSPDSKRNAFHLGRNRIYNYLKLYIGENIEYFMLDKVAYSNIIDHFQNQQQDILRMLVETEFNMSEYIHIRITNNTPTRFIDTQELVNQ